MTSLAAVEAQAKAKTSHWRLSRTRGFDQKRKARVFLKDPFENDTDTMAISMQDITPPGFNRRLRTGTDSSQDSGIHKDISTNELTSSSSEDSCTTAETIKESKSLDNILGRYYEGKVTLVPVVTPSSLDPEPSRPSPSLSPGPQGDCENNNLVEEVYISKHDCDNRRYQSDSSLSNNSIGTSISSDEIERTLASLESCQVEIHTGQTNGNPSTTSTNEPHAAKTSTDTIKLKISGQDDECNNNDVEADPKVTIPSRGECLRHPQLEHTNEYQSAIPVDDIEEAPYKVIIAIDFGTTYTGYAFSFVSNDCDIHIMRKWEGKGVFRLHEPISVNGVFSQTSRIPCRVRRRRLSSCS
uniref:Heat shock 70 kDa protein 12B n=1 Tax=Cacopsylla melanoneura TaxID=428564 RepID=A0A8D8TAG3_9HEMI